MTTPSTNVYTLTEVESVWQAHSRFAPLAENEVHIWLANLDLEVFALPQYLRNLSLAERTRAQRLRFDHDRRRFVLAKGLLRHLIGEYIGMPPSDLQFVLGASGKPELAPRLKASYGSFQFNQAHSGSMAIYAFCKGRRVGVDIEEIRAFSDLENVAELLFSPHELELFRALPEDEVRKFAFFRAWTQKEAFVKALGQGLTVPLNQFEVTVAGKNLARIVQNHNQPPQPLGWFVRDIPISSQFTAAVCVEGEGWKLNCSKW